MKTNSLVLIAVLVASIDINRSTCLAQGALTPPGAPAPTMKSLDQIEARTPISSAPFTITQPGSYYLTTNVTVGSGDAITITANNVTLDLNGFTISSTAPVASTDNGILLSGSRTNIAIRNGHISSGVTNNGAGVYSGSGFGFGVIFSGFPVNVRVSGLSVSGCQYDGIYLGYGSTVVESCVVNTVGAYGIQAQSVSDSTAIDCGTTAISATTANNCVGSVSSSGSGVYANTANGCYGNSLGSGYGVYANGNAQNCYGSSSSGTAVYATIALNCYGSSSSYIGVEATTAENCWGSSISGSQGLIANCALNCYGTSNGNGVALNATGIAQNCYGYNNGGGDGISATSALNCFGYSNGNGTGIYVGTTAMNCYGQGGLYGLYAAEVATCCGGYSQSGTGLNAVIANVCHGSTFSGTALTTSHNVNSY